MDTIKTPHRGLYDAYERCIPSRPEVKSERVALNFRGGHLEFYVQDMGLGPELSIVLSHQDGTIETKTRIKTTPNSLVQLGHMFLEAAATEYSVPFKSGAVAHTHCPGDDNMEDCQCVVCSAPLAESEEAFIRELQEITIQRQDAYVGELREFTDISGQRRPATQPKVKTLSGDSGCTCDTESDEQLRARLNEEARLKQVALAKQVGDVYGPVIQKTAEEIEQDDA